MEFFTTLQLGPHREVTKEGFTLFRDVSISRTGEQIYGPGETSIEPGPDGLVRIIRRPEEVFSPETLASCNGKSLVIDHPEDDVTPENWTQLTQGFMVNARRGSGDQRDECVADVLVTTMQAIQEIDSGKREVSLGYDADYFKTGDGIGEQRNLFINHIALVDAGRCGSRCAIRDKAHKGDKSMKLKDRIAAFKATVNKTLDEMSDEPDETAREVHIHNHLGNGSTSGKEVEVDKEDKTEDGDPTEKRFKAIEDSIAKVADAVASLAKARDKAKDEDETEEEKKKRLEKEAKEKTEDDDPDSDDMADEAPEGKEEESKKANDSAYLEDSFAQVKSVAEIIAPGVRIPTFDKAADPKKTFKDCICGLRRKALDMGVKDADTLLLINQVRGKTTDAAVVRTLPCGQVKSLFNGVGTLKAAQNNAALFKDGVRRTGDAVVEKSLAEQYLEASNARWNSKK